MKRSYAHICASIMILTVVALGLSNRVGAAKPSSDTPVTSTIDGLGIDTLPTLRIQSDQLGAYSNSSSLQSILQGALGDWVLDMLNYNSSPQRKVLIDLRDAVPGSGPGGVAPTPPFTSQMVRSRFLAQCAAVGTNMGTLPVGVPVYCPLIIAIDDVNGVRYRLTMNPPNFGETQYAKVTCLAASGSLCKQWQIEPSVTQLDGQLKNVTKLLKVATKPHQADQDLGDFYMSFSIHLTTP